MADIMAELYCPDCDEKLLQEERKTAMREVVSCLDCPVCKKGWIIGDGKFSLPPEEILEKLKKKYDFFMKEPEFPVLKIKVPYSLTDKVIEFIKNS